MRHTLGALVALLLLVVGSACSGVSEDNLNTWMNTQRGPEKIEEALMDSTLEPNLRAVAARNLIRMDRWAKVQTFLEDAPTDERLPVVAALVPKLWEDARLSDKLVVPSPVNTNAKDALFELRVHTDDAGRQTIDGYLVEWLSGYYEGRSKSGRIGGHIIVRAIGPKAAEGLIEAGRSVVAAPPDAEGNYQQVGDNLLFGLALSGSPEAVAFVLDLAASPSKDKSLQDRAMAALYKAYVKPVGVEPADPAALKPHADRLSAIIRDHQLPGVVRNDAAYLVTAMGMPECLPVFVGMVSFPDLAEAFKWLGAEQALRCGGLEAIVPVAEAMPPTAPYAKGVLEKHFLDDALALTPKSAIAEKAESLLASQNPIARLIGIELLSRVGLKGRVAQDAEKIAALAGDGFPLTGWWGTSKADAAKKPPTLGQRARELAAELRQAERR